jgi:transcriptional regulator with AAA-type ATPase domain
MLWDTARVGEVEARSLRQHTGLRLSIDRALARCLDGIDKKLKSPTTTGVVHPEFSRLDVILQLLETKSHGFVQQEKVIDISLALEDAVGASLANIGLEFTGVLARHAPSFFGVLRDAVSEQIGYVYPASPAVRAVASALATLRDIWGPRSLREVLGASYTVQWRRSGSRAALSRQVESSWQEDPSTFWRIRELKNSAVVRSYGYIGPSSAAPRIASLDVGITHVRDRAIVSMPSSLAPTGPKGSADGQAGQIAHTRHQFLGVSNAAKQIRTNAEEAAGCELPVLIVGETGVGKGLVARAIHAASRRSRVPMVVVDCGAVSESILESELFGHCKGAFTGALSDHAGVIARANDATLLLAHIDSMPLRMQSMLLRVLESGEFRPVGSDTVKRSKFRLIATGAPRLFEAVERGSFRQDLYFRLRGIVISIPSLRTRPDDIPAYARDIATRLGVTVLSSAMSRLEEHSWPGNVRELENVLKAASFLARDCKVTAADVEDAIVGTGSEAPVPANEDSAGRAWRRARRQLQQLPAFCASDFARVATVSRRSAQRYLARLVAQGTITRVGAGRGTRYTAVAP